MKLYETNEMFDRETYVNLLKEMNISAEITEGGVLINIDEYKENYHGYSAPHMVFMNHRFVKRLY